MFLRFVVLLILNKNRSFKRSVLCIHSCHVMARIWLPDRQIAFVYFNIDRHGCWPSTGLTKWVAQCSCLNMMQISVDTSNLLDPQSIHILSCVPKVIGPSWGCRRHETGPSDRSDVTCCDCIQRLNVQLLSFIDFNFTHTPNQTLIKLIDVSLNCF